MSDQEEHASMVEIESDCELNQGAWALEVSSQTAETQD